MSSSWLALKTPLNGALERGLRGASIIPWGIDFLDDALLGICNTDLTLLGASTGAGKTAIATHVAYNAARRGKRVVYFALEAEDGEIEERILWSEMCREWWVRNPHGKRGVNLRYVAWRQGLLEGELGEIEKDIHSRLRADLSELQVVYKNEKGEFGVDDFLQMFEAIESEAQLIVIDHMHYFDFDDDNENRALKHAAKKIRSAALRHRRPVLLLAHLRKANRPGGEKAVRLPDIDDFYGHSDLVKIGVNVILAARADDTHLKSRSRATWLYLPKCRHAGDAYGYAAIVGYDINRGTYAPGYQLYRAPRWGEPQLVGKDDLPSWASRARACGPSRIEAPDENERLF